jgi:hypothetical protein
MTFPRCAFTVISLMPSLNPTCLMNKQVAGRLGLCEGTVKLYRGQAMRKMGARSLAELVRMAEALDLHAGDRRAENAVSAGADHDSL